MSGSVEILTGYLLFLHSSNTSVTLKTVKGKLQLFKTRQKYYVSKKTKRISARYIYDFLSIYC